jgi:hypothetical protein
MNTETLTFEDEANAKVRSEITEIVESASSFEDIIEVWLFKRRMPLCIGRSITSSGVLSSDEINIGFNGPDDAQYGDLTIKINEVTAPYDGVVSFDTFVKGWSKFPEELLVNREELELWSDKLGFVPSDALYGGKGSRRAGIMLILAFAISKGGFVELSHVSEEDFAEEEYKEALKAEGIDIKDYFKLQPGYSKDLTDGGATVTMFGSFYCNKSYNG